MRSDAHVLIVSTKLDASTDAVVQALGGLGVRWTRFDTEEYPFAARLTSVVGGEHTISRWTSSGGEVSTTDVTSVWYRRVRTPPALQGMSPGVHDFCIRESRAALVGTLLALKGLPVMSAPESVWAAEHKILQLTLARQVGLAVPETVVTNDPDEFRRAFNRFGMQMIAKPVRTGFVDLGSDQRAIYTSRVLEEHLEDLGGAELSPVILQPLLTKQTDVRATFVGDRIFVAEIESQTDPAAVIDWRQTVNPKLPHRASSLPAAVESRARALMRALGLQFGALDFVRTPAGEWLFLEVNPNGQWLWLDDFLQLGITDAIAAWHSAAPVPRPVAGLRGD